MTRGWRKDKRYTDDDTMPFEEIARRMNMSVAGVVRVYDRAMDKLRLRFSSPARRQWLRDLLAPLPGAPSKVFYGRVLNPAHTSHMDLRLWPLQPRPRKKDDNEKTNLHTH
jgi:hypothetical protein